MVSYTLQVKQLDGTVVRRVDPSPGMLQRPNLIDRDPGRPWSGDLFETDYPTDPEQAWARFTGETVTNQYGRDEEVEAWIDRSADGTVIGWVRQGERVWRYTDPEAWALDVDGADMKRTDSPDATQDAEPVNTVDGENADDLLFPLADGDDPDGKDAAEAADEIEEQIAEALDGDIEDPEHSEDEDSDAEDEEDDEDKKPWESKTLRLVVHPKA